MPNGDESMGADQVLDLIRRGAATQPTRPDPSGVDEFKRPGIPLDRTTGAPFGKRFNLSFAATDADKIARLQRSFEGVEVVQTPNNFILRNFTDPKTGEVKDLLVDEESFTKADLADLSKAGMQTVSEALMFGLVGSQAKKQAVNVLGRVGRRVAELPRFRRLAAESVGGAAISQGTGVFSELVEKASRKGAIDPGEIFARSVLEGLQEAGLGFGLASVPEGITAAFNVGTKRAATSALLPDESRREGLQALGRLMQSTGEEVLPSLGDIAESPIPSTVEDIWSKLPVFGKAVREMRIKKRQQIQNLQLKILGNEPPRPFAELGAEATELVKNAARTPATERSLLQSSIVTRAADELDSAMSRIQPSSRPFTIPGVASIQKMAARSSKRAFSDKSDELFTEVGNPMIPTAPIARMLPELESKFPDIKELVPASLMRKIEGLKKLGDEIPLEQLRSIRNEIDESIVSGRGLEDASTRDLKSLRHILTQTMNEADVPGLKKINKFYAQNIELFENPLIARLLKERSNDSGFIGNYALIEQLKTSPDDFKTVENFLKTPIKFEGEEIFPAQPEAFNVLRKGILSDIFSRAQKQVGEGVPIDAKDALTQLNVIREASPEVLASILGGEEKVIMRNLDLLSKVEKGQLKLDEDDFMQLLKRPSTSTREIDRLKRVTEDEAKLFENNVVRGLIKGDVNPNDIQAEKLFEWMLDRGSQADIAQVMSIIGDDPVLRTQVQRKMAHEFIKRGARTLQAEDLPFIGDITKEIDFTKLGNQLNDEAYRGKLRTIVGDETFRILEDLTKSGAVLASRGEESMAGGLAAGSMLMNMTKILTNAPKMARLWFVPFVVTNEKLRRYIASGDELKPAVNINALSMGIVSSVPFLEAVAEDFGQSAPAFIMDLMNGEIGDATQAQEIESVEQMNADQVLQLLNQ